MCNTNNTELIRQQLWCDVVKQNSENLTLEKSLSVADKLLEEFDNRFVKKIDLSYKGNTERTPPIVDTSTIDKRKPLRDATTYIERGLNPREAVRTESPQVKPMSPKGRVIKETGLLYEVKQFFGFKNNQDSFE